MSYSSKGLNTDLWGPHYWFVMFVTAMGIPTTPSFEVKKAYANFYESLKMVLPCPKCRESYSRYIKEIPPMKYTIDSVNMFYWVYLIKSKVNQKLRDQGKVIPPDPPFKNIYNRYKNFLNSEEKYYKLGVPKLPKDAGKYTTEFHQVMDFKDSRLSSKSSSPRKVKSLSKTKRKSASKAKSKTKTKTKSKRKTSTKKK